MHIVDGVLSAPVLMGGGVATALGTAWGLRRLTPERVPIAGVLSAALFIASLMHIPIGPSSVHMMLNGLLALLLGPVAFPAVLVAVLLQSVFFGYGGILVLGVNVFNVAAPAVVLAWLLRGALQQRWAAVLLGAGSVLGTSVLVAASLALSGEAFWPAAQLTVLAHLPLAMIEGGLVVAAWSLLRRVRPSLLTAAL